MAAKCGELVTEGRLRFWSAASMSVLVFVGACMLPKNMLGADREPPNSPL
jgi:hypothetical protein